MLSPRHLTSFDNDQSLALNNFTGLCADLALEFPILVLYPKRNF